MGEDVSLPIIKPIMIVTLKKLKGENLLPEKLHIKMHSNLRVK